MSLKAAPNPISMQLTSQFKFNHTPMKIQSIVLCINAEDLLPISSAVYDTMLPAQFIYNHVNSLPFIATHEGRKTPGGTHFC